MHSHMLHISLVWLHNITHNNDTVVNPPNSNVRHYRPTLSLYIVMAFGMKEAG